MIYTVTFSPALDYAMWFENIEIGGLNRAARTVCRPGGKGINVSMVLSRLGIPSVCLGFAAGFVGREIIRSIEQAGLQQEFILLREGCSRINVKVKARTETELNASGPAIPPEALDRLGQRVSGLKEGDLLVLSGNPPVSVSETVYADLAAFAARQKVRTVVDASGTFLTNALRWKPYLIKPNLSELEGLEGRKLISREEMTDAAKKLQKKGAEHVLVSMGAQGAILVSPKGVYNCGVPQGRLIDSTGAGDSMVAAFLAKKMAGCRDADCLRYAVACGSASAYSYDLATAESLAQMYMRTPDACAVNI